MYREGDWVFISKTGNESCQVKNLRSIQNLRILKNETSEVFICRAMTVTKSNLTGTVRNGKGLSYTKMREILLEELASIGFKKLQFGLHSLRTGGAKGGVADSYLKVTPLMISIRKR